MPEDRFKDPEQLLREYQTGISDDTEVEIPITRSKQTSIEDDSTSEPERGPFSFREYLRSNPLSTGELELYTDEAKHAGFGLSKYDRDFTPGMDLEHNRALEQSSFSKIGTGLMKGGITAATTAVNTTIGTLFGLGASLFELATDSNENGRSVMDTIDAGTNNWLSNQLVKIQNWSEEALPNYRTIEERSEQYQKEWYKHMGTANFIGDFLLKNFGFTVGAMVGGMAWSKLIGAGLSKQLANNIMKGAVVAAEGDAEAAAAMKAAAEAVARGEASASQQGFARAAEAVARGTAFGVDTEQVLNNIQNAARAINRYGAKLQLYGAVVGAMGEGTVEGIMAKNEFLEQFDSDLQRRFNREYNNLERDILNSGNYDWITFDNIEEGEGKTSSTGYLSDNGRAELLRRQKELVQKYDAIREKAEIEGNRLASTTYLLNLPVLTTSNVLQFGRMFAGGWSTARNTMSSIRGGVITRAGENGALELSANLASKYGTGSVAGKTILGALKNAGSEFFEEMAQGSISSGAKNVADSRLTAFNDDGYDAEAIYSVRGWFEQMAEGGQEYLGDIKNWQEGALGAITGLFGIPGKRWSGGVAGAYRDARDEVDGSRAAVDKLNSLVNSKEFQERWRDYIRHLKYDNQMEDAVEKDNEYAWHTASDAQLINDVMTFADAGRMEDLNQIVSAYGNLSASDAASLREVLKDDSNPSNAWVQNASDQEIVDKVKKQADSIKSAIDSYKQTYDALSTRAPIGSSPEYLKELVFTSMQMKNFENRFLQMFGETMTAIEPVIRAMASVDENGNARNAEEIVKNADALRNSYESIFAGNVLPVRIPRVIKALTDSHLKRLEDFAEKQDPKLRQKISDMRKLTEDRQKFFEKLQTLQSDKGIEKFNQDAINQTKVDDAAEKAKAKQDTNGLDTVDKVKIAYFRRNAKEQAEFSESLDAMEDSNPAIKEFLKLKRRYDDFSAYAENNPITSENPWVTRAMITNALSDIFRKSRNENELVTLPDSVFPSYEKFAEGHQIFDRAPDRATYASMKKAIRDSMTAYMKQESAVGPVNADTPSSVPQPEPADTSTPEGYDAAQPGSQEAPPAANNPAVAPEQSAEEPEKKSVPKEAAQEQAPVIELTFDKPTEEQLTDDAIDAAEETFASELEFEKKSFNGEKGKTPYYRTSVPEIETGEAKKARDGIAERTDAGREKFKSADLSDFVINHPAFAETWNALKDRGAFDFVATSVRKGDVLEFVVDNSFPRDENGDYQILVTTNRNGQRQVLTVLSRQTSQYYGLQSLREAIDDEYQEFRRSNPNDVFVFSKKSKVWATRAGLIDYDFSRQEEKPIQDIPAYNADAPIVFINGNGEAEVVRGNDKGAAGHVSASFNDAEYNRENERMGNLYYLVKSGDTRGRYIPIRLNVEHFRSDNIDLDSPTFQKIKDILGKIEEIVRNTDSENVAEQDVKMRNQLAELKKYLNISKDYFKIDNYPNVGPALRYSTPTSSDDKMWKPSDMNDGTLVRYVASLGRSVQILQEENGKVRNLDSYIDEGLITSNARKLRPKGVDFYFEPWNGTDFEAATAAQVEAEKEIEKNDVDMMPPDNAPLPDEEPENTEYVDPSSEPAFWDQLDFGTDLWGGSSDDSLRQFSEKRYVFTRSEKDSRIAIPVKRDGESNDDFMRRSYSSIRSKYRSVAKNYFLSNGNEKTPLGDYDYEKDIIRIFAKEGLAYEDYEDTFFHENLHAYLYKNGLDGNSKALNDFIQFARLYVDNIDIEENEIRNSPSYEGAFENEELFVRLVSSAMVQGVIPFVLQNAPAEAKSIIENYLNVIGYDRQSEQEERRDVGVEYQREERSDESAQLEMRHWGTEEKQGRDASEAINYAGLDSSIREQLENKGYTEEEFNQMPEALKDRVLHCLGV